MSLKPKLCCFDWKVSQLGLILIFLRSFVVTSSFDTRYRKYRLSYVSHFDTYKVAGKGKINIKLAELS